MSASIEPETIRAIDSGGRMKDVSNDIQVSGKIDHIFISPDLCDRLEGVAIDEHADGSDHKPIQAVLNLAVCRT